MNFELSQDHKVLQDAVRDFVNKEIKPIAAQIDEEHHIPDPLVAKLGEMGFWVATCRKSMAVLVLTCCHMSLLLKRFQRPVPQAAY